MSEKPRRERVREQQRRQTIDEIVDVAFALVDEGGAAAVTIAAVAKTLGMSAPALYRYFPSREALIDALVTDAYSELAAALVSASEPPAAEATDQVLRIVEEYRRWALAHPRRYWMLFSDRGPNAPEPAEGVAAFERAMVMLLATLTTIVEDDPGPPLPPALAESLRRWGRKMSAPEDTPPRALLLGAHLWTQLQGTLALEISGVFANMGLDAGALLEHDVRTALAR